MHEPQGRENAQVLVATRCRRGEAADEHVAHLKALERAVYVAFTGTKPPKLTVPV